MGGFDPIARAGRRTDSTTGSRLRAIGRAPRSLLRLGPALAIAVLILGLLPGSVMADADHFQVTGPSLVTTGVQHTYTITAMDGSDVDTGYSGTVDIACSDLDSSVVCPTNPSSFTDGVATVDVTLVTVGPQSITATDDSDASITGTIDVTVTAAGVATQLVFDAPASAYVGSPASVTVTAEDDLGSTDTTYAGPAALTSTDGGAVFDPVSPVGFASGVAAIDVTFSAVGSYTVTATDGSLTGTSAAISVGAGTPTINFTSTAPSSAVVGGSTYSVTADSPSPATIGFTIDATASTVCSISGHVVSFTAVGSCVIDANQPASGDGNWNAADQAQQSFSVGAGTPTINFTSTASSPVVGGTYNVTTSTNDSETTVILSIDATS
ncbi:MAG: hypothetical protein ABSA21_12320, partial [Candidatus Limnocylindrales bacterium]